MISSASVAALAAALGSSVAALAAAFGSKMHGRKSGARCSNGSLAVSALLGMFGGCLSGR